MKRRRWLKNEKVSVDLFYLPFITILIQCLAKQTLLLAIDGSTTAQGCITLMVSMIYKGRFVFTMGDSERKERTFPSRNAC